MFDFTDITVVIQLTGLILGTGMFISTLEYVFNRREYQPDGLFSWHIWQELEFRNYKTLKKVSAPFFSAQGVVMLLVIRLGLIAVFLYLLAIGQPLNFAVTTALFLTQLYLNFRIPYGKDGSDQMSTIVLCMLFFISAFPDNMLLVNSCLIFIAYQSIISYLTAGIAKLISPTWLKGDIVYDVLNTRTYGNKRIASILKDYKYIRRAFTYTTIGFESLFFIVFFLRAPYNALFLIIPFGFHLSSALFMGLNSFVFAFVSTYPSVLYVVNRLHRVIDALPSLF